MKHLFTSSLSKSLLPKLALSLALILMGNVNIWGGDILSISFADNNFLADWDNGGTYNKITYNSFGTSEDGIYSQNSYSTYSLTSKKIIKLDVEQKIVLNASLYPETGSSAPSLQIFVSTDGTTWNQKVSWTSDFTYGVFKDYTYEVANDYSDGCYIQIRAKRIKIKSLEIQAAPEDLTTIDEDVDPGEFKTGTSNVTVKYTAKVGWNSICVPIQLRTYTINHLTSIFGDGFKAYTLSSYDNGTLTFAPIAASGYVQANTPLVVYAPNASGSQSNFVANSASVTYSSNPSATAGDATFQGTYAPIAKGAMTGNYGLTPSGKIMKAGSGASLKGYRAYFTGISAPSGVKMIVIDEEGGETDLGIVKMVDEKANDVYTLAGQKVQKGRKGIYIVNGKKVVIK